MTVVLVGVLVGAVSSALAWLLVRDVFDHPTLARRNVRGLDVATAGGIVVVLALLPGWAVGQMFASHQEAVDLGWERVLVGAFGLASTAFVFALLGLVDDLLARGADRGFRGHVGALLSGRLTTGGIKLVGGGLAALALTSGAHLGWHLVNAAIVALSANLANLFDRAPGRVTKVSILALVGLVAAVALVGSADDLVSFTQRTVLTGAALVVGAAVGLLGPELREQVMLGDTGSNVIGAVLGLAVVSLLGPPATVVVLVVLVALNVVSEKVSFSAVIERTPPLRWLDQLGRVRT